MDTLLCLSAAIPAGATVLTFDGPGAGYATLTNYGSNMTGLCAGSGQAGCVSEGNGFTPDIAVSYTTIGYTSYMRAWPGGYGDLLYAAYPATTGYLADVTLTPQNGVTLTLNSFDLAGYYEADIAGQTVEVLNSTGGILENYSGTILGTGPADSSYTPDITSTTPIQIVYGPSWDDGIDNINFDETPATASATPEPSTWFLLLTGFGALAVLQRRARSAGKQQGFISFAL